MKFNYVQQLDETDCGAAALSMVFSYYNCYIPLYELRDKCQTDQNGTSALGLVKAAQNYGFDAQGVELSIENLKEYTDIPLPFIVHVNINSGTLHFITIIELHEDYLLTADPNPDKGISKMTYQELHAIWTGICILIVPSTTFKGIKKKESSLLQLVKIILKHKKIILSIIVSSLTITLISIGGSLFLQLIIDVYIPNLRIAQLLIVSASLFLSYILYALFNYFSGYLSLVLSQKLSIDLLLKYIRHLFDVPIAFFNTRRTGELTSRLEDANNIIHILASTIISAFLNIGTVFLIGTTLFILDIKLFLITATLIPLYFLIVYKFMRKFDKANSSRMESGARLVSTLIEDIHGMETIKAFNIVDSQYRQIDHKFVDQLEKNFEYEKLNVLQTSLKDVVRLTISLLILSTGALLVVHDQLSLGKLVAFNSLVTYFILPLEEIINLQSNLQTAKIANMRLNQILNVPKEEVAHKIASKELLEFKSGEIVMKNIQFEYKYGQPVLNHLNATIPLGTSTAIIGLSGSGKSTLAKLLMGFYEPVSGEIKLQFDAQSSSLKSYQQQIVYLPQKPYIFSGTIQDNITLGRFKNIEESKIEHVAKLAQIHDDIKKLPDGYNTKLFGNDMLSGGQQQRIAIARALLSDATVLIFDEATSNLDVKTEQSVLDNILQLQNKTVIFIAHRLYIAKKTDQILVMDKGQIIENGTHAQLFKQKGQYYKLLEA